MAKRNWMNEIFGGQILVNSNLTKHYRIIILGFTLSVIYISLNYSVENSLRIERKNNAELKHLRSDYTSKMARLQYNSKREEIERKLRDLGSELKAPNNPPNRIIIDIR